MSRLWLLVFALIVSVNSAFAVGSSVPNLPPASTPTGTELLYCDQGGADRKCTINQIVGAGGAVASLAALAAHATTDFPNGVWRTTYGNGNGAPPLFYTPSGSACSFNAGAGDNGAQVASADSKCWLASFPSGSVDVRQWGAVSDGASAQAGAATFTATANGTTTISVTTTAGIAVGQRVTSVGWATRQAASLPIVPSGTTVSSFVANTSITLSASVPTMTAALVAWGDNVTGTDNTAAFQAMFDYGMQSGVADFYCQGNFKISDTLQMGWGAETTFGGLYGLRLSGGYRGGYNGLPGCNIYPTQTDRPAINFQSGRQVGLYGVTIWGRLANYLLFMMGSGFNLSPNVNDWLPPEFTPSGTSGGFAQHAPWVGVTVDAYSGASPSPAYPNLTFPTWTGLSGQPQYNKAVTSDIELKNVNIVGFGAGLAVGLNTNNNGDFLKLTNVELVYTPYGLSITNTQSRNVNIENVICGFNYTVIDQTTLGMQQGEFNGPIRNLGCSPSYQLFNFGSLGIAGPLDISEVYCEGCVRIGNFVSSTSFSALVDLRDSTFNVTEQFHGQIPACLITATNAEIRMTGINFNGNQRISNLFCGGAQTVVSVQGGGAQSATVSPPTAAALQAINYSGGVFAGAPRYNSSGINNWSVPQYYLGTYYSTLSFTGAISGTTLTVSGGVTGGSLAVGSCIFTGAGVTANTCITALGSGTGGNGTYTVNNSQSIGAEAMTAGSGYSSYPHGDVLTRGNLTNRFPMTQDMKTYVDTQGRSWQMTVPAPTQLTFPSSIGSQISVLPAYTADIMTFNYCTIYQGGTNGISYVMAPGDILYHFNSGTIFVVLSIGTANSDPTCTSGTATSSQVTVVQQNNLTVTPNTNTWASNTNATPGLNSGNTALIKTGVVIPGQLEFGIYTNGSTSVTNVSNGNGVVGTDLATYYKNGDLVLAPFQFGPGSAPWPTSNLGGNSYATVTAANPGTITLGSAATASGLFPIFPYELGGHAIGGGGGNAPTVAVSGTCAAPTPSIGNALSGTITLTAACAATNTITLSALPAAQAATGLAGTGYACHMDDRTTRTSTIVESSTSTTTAVFTVGATATGTTDVLQYDCTPY